MKRILLILVIIAAVLAAATVLAAYSYGRFSDHALGAPSAALAVGTGTDIDSFIAPLTDAHPGESGVAMVPDSLDAFALRSATARDAGRSLDLMYYIWEFDLTGLLLAREVLAAADRGVRVRIIIDDATTHGSAAYMALASHPNIELRLFNPTQARDNTIRRGFEMAFRFFTITRRMHNKAWIADGRVAVVGGRNIGDDYFDASADSNFSDMDAALFGPAVQQTEGIFDEFWNSRVVLPMESLAGTRTPNLPWLRAELDKTANSEAAAPYLARVQETVSAGGFFTRTPVYWSKDVEVLSDPPTKALDEDHSNWLLSEIGRVIDGAKSQVEITAPYFVPGDSGSGNLLALAKRGVKVSVLTNGLASTDPFPLAFAGYQGYRAPLLAGGINLYELQPQLDPTDTSLFGIGTIGLHAKQFTVDDNAGFIGSFNFDPRSASLNTEMGVLFENIGLVPAMNELFARKTAPGSAFQVTLGQTGGLEWTGELDGKPVTTNHDPETSPFRRALSWGLSWLPVESQL